MYVYWVESGPLAQSVLTWWHDRLISSSYLLSLMMCASQCVVATVCKSAVQVQCVCRLTQCICTGVYSGLHCVHVCVWDALCLLSLNGEECFCCLQVSPLYLTDYSIVLVLMSFVGAPRLLYWHWTQRWHHCWCRAYWKWLLLRRWAFVSIGGCSKAVRHRERALYLLPPDACER